MSNICTPYYDNQYKSTSTFSSTNIKDAILHPNMFNLSTGNESLELWNKGNTATTINSNIVYKTIYSPSPSNYVEPKSAAFNGFTTSGSFNKGWNLFCEPDSKGATIFFSAQGCRNNGSGYIQTVGEYGPYWSAGPSNTVYGRYMDMTSSQIYLTYAYNRNLGLSIRSVYE